GVRPTGRDGDFLGLGVSWTHVHGQSKQITHRRRGAQRGSLYLPSGVRSDIRSAGVAQCRIRICQCAVRWIGRLRRNGCKKKQRQEDRSPDPREPKGSATKGQRNRVAVAKEIHELLLDFSKDL